MREEAELVATADEYDAFGYLFRCFISAIKITFVVLLVLLTGSYIVTYATAGDGRENLIPIWAAVFAIPVMAGVLAAGLSFAYAMARMAGGLSEGRSVGATIGIGIVVALIGGAVLVVWISFWAF